MKYEIYILIKNKTIITQADSKVRKTLRHKVLIGKVVRRKNVKRPEEFGLMRRRESI